jgi:hypothetical protein
MHWAGFIAGLVLVAVGAIVLTGVNIPQVTSALTSAFGYIPTSTAYTSMGVMVLGFLIILFVGFRQKLGKYFKYY